MNKVSGNGRTPCWGLSTPPIPPSRENPDKHGEPLKNTMQNFQKRIWQCKQFARIFKFTWRTPFRSWPKYHRCLSCCIFEIFHFILQIVIAKFGLSINTYRRSKWRNEKKLKKTKLKVVHITSVTWSFPRNINVQSWWRQNWKRNRWSFRKGNQHSWYKKNNSKTKWKIHENFYWWAVRKNVLCGTNEWIY